MMLRTFIAVKIPPTAELSRLHSRLVNLGERFRPVALDNLHITLKFLGETADSRLPELSRALAKVVCNDKSLELQLTGLGAFPHARRPSVIWVGVQPAASLITMAERLDRELAELGFAPESRPFHPHLTLLRIKSRPPEELFLLLAQHPETRFGTVRVNSVELYQSEQQKSGSKYTPLATVALQ